MRSALASPILATALAVGVAAPAAAKAPTRRQVARAVDSAERSRSLWATINICNAGGKSPSIGVRGQMPSLGFASTMSMKITLDSYSASSKRFVPINNSNAVDLIRLGTHQRGLEQEGVIFPFHKGQTGLWNATIQFTWKIGGTIVGQTQRRTTGGHHDADAGQPPHFSVAQCRFQ